MKTLRPQKRSLTIAGHRTSISLEPSFWEELGRLCEEQDKSIATLVNEIDRKRGDIGLSSAIRVHLFNYYREKVRRADPHSATIAPQHTVLEKD